MRFILYSIFLLTFWFNGLSEINTALVILNDTSLDKIGNFPAEILDLKIPVEKLENKVIVFGAGATGFGQDLYTKNGQMNTSLYMAKALQTFINAFTGK